MELRRIGEKIKVNHALKAALWLLEAVSLGEQEERPVQHPGRVPSGFRNAERFIRVHFRPELMTGDR
ncbi:hypothetical protein K0M31_017584 [Melipona bicolor]|uniref:Uncharacterized protein n=1 Tax=Melipona bicolor TaxID=60889 RepID=A0AA40G5C2_9HYME|nr:hypothetical protein K0M31_017584 [Melipona bicolor]